MPKSQKVHQAARAPSGVLGHLSGSSRWCLLYCCVEAKSTKGSCPEVEHLFLVMKMVRWCSCFCRCCNTCDDVREAYRRRGWAFKNPDTIEQCKREGFSQKMQEQKNEGCQVYGFLEVNKVRDGFKLWTCCVLVMTVRRQSQCIPLLSQLQVFVARNTMTPALRGGLCP